jgi:hypothetical protein
MPAIFHGAAGGSFGMDWPAGGMEFLAVAAFEEYDDLVVPTPTSSLALTPYGIRCPMEALARRLEDRIPLTVRVDLCSLDVRQRAQEAVTENVSTHGARVVSTRPWKLDARLNLHSLPGDFRARARVIYCESLGTHSFAIGLQLLAAAGNWN